MDKKRARERIRKQGGRELKEKTGRKRTEGERKAKRRKTINTTIDGNQMLKKRNESGK